VWALGLFLAVTLLASVVVNDKAQQIRPAPGPVNDSALFSAQVVAAMWLGAPALWQPQPIDGVEFRFYDVSGTTQTELEDSMLASDICSGTYGTCLPDPGNPGGRALALEGQSQPAPRYCYSPRTFTFQFTYFVVLPRWTPPADGSVLRVTVDAWNSLLHVLYTHEARHVAIAKADIADLNAEAQGKSSCAAAGAFWADPHLFDKLTADQNAFHAQLRANCQPALGCVPYNWMGW
jgi:predicted secreted Zn-dependent protease